MTKEKGGSERNGKYCNHTNGGNPYGSIYIYIRFFINIVIHLIYKEKVILNEIIKSKNMVT